MKSLIFFLSLFSVTVFADNFEEANALYLKGEYKEAAKAYSSLIRKTPKGEYYFNLGSAQFRNGDMAEALFNFRKASEKLPRDEDVKYNLEYVRSLKKESLKTEVSFAQKFLIPLRAEESIILLFLLSCVVVFLFKSQLAQKSKIWLNIRYLMMFLFLGLLVNHVSMDMTEKAYIVVKSDGTKVYSGPGSTNVVLFEVNNGSEADLIQNFNNKWIQVKFSKNKKGWIYRDNLVM